MSDDLDSLIANLNNRLNESASPSARGYCGACKRDIHGRIIQALGNQYHPECWRCSKCRQVLQGEDFFHLDNKPYCQKCHDEMNYPKCDYCHQSITTRYVDALNKKFHEEHFMCQRCNRNLDASRFYIRDNQHVCESCVGH